MNRRSVWKTGVVGAAIAVGALTLVVKVAGAAKELAIAYVFGINRQLGAFIFAYMFLAFMTNVLSAALQMALIPKYLRVQAESGDQQADALAARMAGLTIIALSVGVVLLAPLFVILVPGLARGFDANTTRQCQEFVLLLAPSIVLSGASTVWSGVLNANRRFWFAASVPIATPICVVVSILLVGSSLGGASLVIGTIAGAAIEAVLLASRVRQRSAPISFNIIPLRVADRGVLREFVPAAAANVLMAGTMLIEQSFAASISAADVAAYSFGTKMTGVCATVLVTTLSTVLLPHFASISARSGIRELRQTVTPVFVAVAAISVPVSCIFVLESSEITRVLFQRGHFNADDTALVSRIQAIHALYIPIYALGMVAVRLINAMSATKILLVGSGINLVVSYALNLWLSPRLGVTGIAWSNVGMYLASALFLWVFVLRLFARHNTSAVRASGS